MKCTLVEKMLKNQEKEPEKEKASAVDQANAERDHPPWQSIKERLRYTSELVIGVALLMTFSWYLAYSLMQEKDNCRLLFAEGQWVGDTWKPKACEIHVYKRSEIEICLRNNKVYFIGDLKLHKLYHTLEERLRNQSLTERDNTRENMNYTDFHEGIELEIQTIPASKEKLDRLLKLWLKAKTKVPSLVISSFGQMENLVKGKSSMEVYRENLTEYKRFLSKLSQIQRNKVLGKIQPRIVWKLEEPVSVSHYGRNISNKANETIQEANLAARSIMKSASIRIMEASYEMARTEDINSEHRKNIKNAEIDLILNLFCNQLIQPKDATCCKKVEGTMRYHYSAITILACCMLLFIVLIFWSRS
ncbi:N-acetylneuraminate 9-O-acetyltransferase-like [Rhopilema esculentum]|uniref:N-acetylneuraminate 9-O-acetyltransferase-like n=1 Tax=Rhopilema esculentum TaxID=499914 RepID=UPI0031D74544